MLHHRGSPSHVQAAQWVSRAQTPVQRASWSAEVQAWQRVSQEASAWEAFQATGITVAIRLCHRRQQGKGVRPQAPAWRADRAQSVRTAMRWGSR